MIFQEQLQVLVVEGFQNAIRSKEAFKILQGGITTGTGCERIMPGQVLLERLVNLPVPLTLQLGHRPVQHHPPAFRGQPVQYPVERFRLRSEERRVGKECRSWWAA